MRRIIQLVLFFMSHSLVCAQPALTAFDNCSEFIGLSIDDLIGNSSELSDTSMFCLLNKFLDNPNDQIIDVVIDLVHNKAAENLQAGYFSLAKEYRTIQAHLAIALNNDSIYMEALYQIALSSYRMGDVLNAARFNMEGKIIAIRDSLHMRHISFLYRESWIYWRMQRHEKAINSMQKCRDLAAIHSPNEGYLFSYHNGLGSFYKSLENYEKSRFHQDSSIFYAEKLCFIRAKAIAKADRANAYEEGDESDLHYRTKLINEALLVSQQQLDREQISINYSLLASMKLLANDYDGAIEMYDSVNYYTQVTKDQIRELHTLQGKSKAYEGLGKYKKALELEKQHFVLHNKLYGASTMSDIFDLEQASLEREADFYIEKVQLENDLKTLKLSKGKNNIFILLLAALLASLLAMFWFFSKKQKQEIEILLLNQENQRQIIKLEKKALQSQMNPHFIFNSLNSIKSYIAKNEGRTATRFLNKFSQLMRIILANSGAQLVSLNEELNSLKLYIELEQFRLNNSFEFKIINKIGLSDSENILLPPLIIQPYVENAIWHGLVPKEGAKELEIKIQQVDGILKILVRDNGVGREKSEANKDMKSENYKSMGMQITRERIRLHNNNNNNNNNNNENISVIIVDLVDAKGIGQGTEIQINLPVKTELND